MGKLPLFISPKGVQCSDREDTAWLISIKFIRIPKAVSPAQPRTHTHSSVSEEAVVSREGSQGLCLDSRLQWKGQASRLLTN